MLMLVRAVCFCEWLLQCSQRSDVQDDYWQWSAAKSAQRRCPRRLWHGKVRPWRLDLSAQRTPLTQRVRKGHAQAKGRYVQSSISVLRRSSHSSLWSSISSYAFRQPTPARRASLSTRHLSSCRTFSIAGPTVCNYSLPDYLRDPASGFNSFRQFLNTIQHCLAPTSVTSTLRFLTVCAK